MTKMQKLVLLMTFWFTARGPDEEKLWDAFTDSKPFTEENLFNVIAFVINGIDDKFVQWHVLDAFVEEMNSKSGIVVDQVETPVAAAEGSAQSAPLTNPDAAVKTPRKRKPKKEVPMNTGR